ncbi:capsular polysaccharide export ABC transporter transmembrane protein [Caballeronia pedi]|uniref:Capsular polysaccharide export ABC transporter transmembrane protein n=1 Tax=Caballeronia pedi TaxID=1777141 RepID=A0A158D1B2_9BURK|nr:ABC transporter permease [Caballeronia pedi]SAK87627.1 capsular polysaccharide export ABC transporter transmembrane protein [Caballeronia pedi]
MTNNDRISKWRARQAAGNAIGAGGFDRPDPAAEQIDAKLVDAVEGKQAAPAEAVGAVAFHAHMRAFVPEPQEAQPETTAAHDGARPATLLARMLAALRGLPRQTVADRRAAYEAVSAQLDDEAAVDQLDEETADFRRRTQRTTIRLLEDDIRAGVDVFAAGYAPATLAAHEARLASAFGVRAQRRRDEQAREARRLASRQDTAFEVELAPDEAADVATLSRRIAMLHARQRAVAQDTERSKLSALLPLLILQLHTIHGESRFALVWALCGPAVLLALISSLYFLTGTHFILGMDVPTFSLLGATTWIMFRQIIFRSSTAYVSARGLLNLPSVTPLLNVIVQATIYLVIYLLVFVILIGIGYRYDFVSLPASWPTFVCYVVSMAIGGTAMGLLFGTIATSWHFFLRLAAVIERFLEVFSGVFFVSEQLPEQFRAYFLWSPFAHGMQLLRSSYFESYKSTDASLPYYLTSLVLLMVVALACERLARSRVQPM